MTRYRHILLLLILPIVSAAQRDKAILKRHFDAQDQELWNQVNTFSTDGVLATGKKTLRVEFLAKKPNKIKIIDEEKNIVYGFNGKAGWMMTSTGQEPVILDEELSMILKNTYEFGSPLYQKENLNYMSEVTVERVRCHWWVYKEKDLRYEFFVDKSRDLIYKVIIEKRSPEGELEYSISKTITQYRNFQGFMTPSVILIRSTHHEWELAFNEMFLGEGIRSSIFEIPKSNQ